MVCPLCSLRCRRCLLLVATRCVSPSTLFAHMVLPDGVPFTFVWRTLPLEGKLDYMMSASSNALSCRASNADSLQQSCARHTFSLLDLLMH